MRSVLARRHGLLACALLIGVIIPGVVAAVSGNLSIPHNDSWAYSRIAQHWAENGQVQLLGWNRSGVFGQVFVLGPLAHWVVIQNLFVIVTGALFLISVHELLHPHVGRLRAGVVTVACAAWPGFALLTTSYMTDVPTLGTSFLALWFADRALARRSRLLFVLAMLVGLWSCTIRPQAIAVPVAIVWIFLRRAHLRRRIGLPLILGMAALVVVGFGAFNLWYVSLPTTDPGAFALRENPLTAIASGSVQAWFTISLVGGPVALAFSRPWRWRTRGWLAALVVVAVGVLALREVGAHSFLLPNYISASGSYAAVMPPERVVFGERGWDIVVVFAVAMGGILAGAVAETTTRAGGVLGIFSVLTIAGTVAEFATVQMVFDRYLIALLPWILALACTPHAAGSGRRAARTAMAALGIASLSATTVLSALLALNAWSFDSARWRFAESLAAAGADPTRINAGLEWLGWHSAQGVINRYPADGWGHERKFSDTPSCMVLTSDPLPPSPETAQWTLAEIDHYRRFLVVGDAALFAYRTNADSCDEE